MAHLTVERVRVLYLDAKNRLIRDAHVADVTTLSALSGGRIPEHIIRRWNRDGELPQRGIVYHRIAYSVDEFVRAAIAHGYLGHDPRKAAALCDATGAAPPSPTLTRCTRNGPCYSSGCTSRAP